MKFLLALLLISSSVFAGTLRDRKTGNTLKAICIERNQKGSCSEYEVTADLYSGVHKKIYRNIGNGKVRVKDINPVKGTLVTIFYTITAFSEWTGSWAWSIPVLPIVAVPGMAYDLVLLPYKMIKILIQKNRGKKVNYIFSKSGTKYVSHKVFVMALKTMGLYR